MCGVLGREKERGSEACWDRILEKIFYANTLDATIEESPCPSHPARSSPVGRRSKPTSALCAGRSPVRRVCPSAPAFQKKKSPRFARKGTSKKNYPRFARKSNLIDLEVRDSRSVGNYFLFTVFMCFSILAKYR